MRGKILHSSLESQQQQSLLYRMGQNV